MTKTRKVLLFVVEGPSDESVYSLFSKVFLKTNVQFCITYGDLTSNIENTSTNIINKINEHVFSFIKRYKIKKDDILKIIHIVDTDGTFVSDDYIKEDAKVPGVIYEKNQIRCPNKKRILERNSRKKQVLRRLIKTTAISSIDYSIYFVSCNLEHVFYDELKCFTNDEKMDRSDEFYRNYEDNIQDFQKFLTTVGCHSSFSESWTAIQENGNSLKRSTNLDLLLSDFDTSS